MVNQVFGRVNTDVPPSASTSITNGHVNGISANEEVSSSGNEASAEPVEGDEKQAMKETTEAEKELQRQSLQDQIIAEAAMARQEAINAHNSKSTVDILGDTEQVFEDESVPEALVGATVQQSEESKPPVNAQEDEKSDDKNSQDTQDVEKEEDEENKAEKP
jgi:hypothetical protein